MNLYSSMYNESLWAGPPPFYEYSESVLPYLISLLSRHLLSRPFGFRQDIFRSIPPSHHHRNRFQFLWGNGTYLPAATPQDNHPVPLSRLTRDRCILRCPHRSSLP